MLDYYNILDLCTPEERLVQRTARDFLDANAMPHASRWWEEETFPAELGPELGRMGYLGANLPAEYGAAGVSNAAYGLIMYELERVDSGLRSFASVQGALVMYPIHAYGSDDQKRRYLPPMARGELIGCFGLTEHEGGSDPGAMATRAHSDGDDYVLTGAKMWISNGNMAHVALIWAKGRRRRNSRFSGAHGQPRLPGQSHQA